MGDIAKEESMGHGSIMEGVMERKGFRIDARIW